MRKINELIIYNYIMYIINNPIINNFYEKKDGISAFMRIKNGQDFLEVSILSIINQVDIYYSR